MQKIALILHLLGACIWVGGHLYLAIRLMPTFIKTNDVKGFLTFEKSYEPLGMSALMIQVITGLYMMHTLTPVTTWTQPMGILTALFHSKLTWLILTLLTAIHARFRVVAKLQDGTHSANALSIMNIHVILICLYSVGFVVTGAFFRWG